MTNAKSKLLHLKLHRFLDCLEDSSRRSLIDEVSATPKPGLVDRLDCGAHRDMNLKTFLDSTSAIVPFIRKMAEEGCSHQANAPESLFASIRPIGILAEQSMFQATAGVNTHKGIIFSMGICAAAAGFLFGRQLQAGGSRTSLRPESVLAYCRAMCAAAVEKDFAAISSPKTHGEQLYLTYGCRGIRGEAADGFPSVRYVGLPALRQAVRDAGCHEQTKLDCSDRSWNAVCLQILLHLMAEVEDSNILYRSDYPSLLYVREQAARILNLGGGLTEQGAEALKELNRDFIRRNLSPGGCADLLSLTLFLWRLEQIEFDIKE